MSAKVAVRLSAVPLSFWGGVELSGFPPASVPVPLSLLPCSWWVLLPPRADSASGVAALCARPVRCFDLGAICLGFFKEHGALLEVLFLNSMCERTPSLPVVRQAAELAQGKGVVALLCGQGGRGREAAPKPALPPEDWQGAAASLPRCWLCLPPLPEVAAHLLKAGRTETKGPPREPAGLLLQLLGGRAAGTAPSAVPREPDQAGGEPGTSAHGGRLHSDSGAEPGVPCPPCSHHCS